MKILDKESRCVGCGLCADVCPQKCITMSATRGFLYPVIDESACVSCGRCKASCPVLKERVSVEPKECYAVADARRENRIKSASGGLAGLLMEEAVARGGSYSGVRLDENLDAINDVDHSYEKIDLYRDSKYVQSNSAQVYRKLEVALNGGKTVLVTGTPCQISAIHSRFGERENLITCDFVCSGVPDPGIFRLYLRELGEKSGKSIKKFFFRDKTNGWKKSNIKVVYEDGTEEIITRNNSDYFKMFGNNIFFRECCYKCEFKNFNTRADITIGDYWGIEKRTSCFDDDTGCSLCIVNTDKGKEFLSGVLAKCKVEETPLEFAIETHPKLIKSIPRSDFRDMFYGKYVTGNAESLKKAIKISMGHSFTDKLRRKIYMLIRRRKDD